MLSAPRLPLSTVDPTEAFDDLTPLAELIGTARVVAVGESSHYAHELYDLRHRLTRFLVERCGFTAIAMESGVPEGFIVDAWIHGAPSDVAEIQARGITWSMGLCDEMRDQLRWLRARHETGARPVHFYGVDLPGSRASLLPALDGLEAYVAELDAPFLPRFERMRSLAAAWAGENARRAPDRYAALSTADRDGLTALLADTEARFDAKRLTYVAESDAESYSVAHRHLRSAVHLDRVMRQAQALREGDATVASANIRDAAMAEAVEWILEREERVILLAHNAHVQRTPLSSSRFPDIRNTSPVGHHLAERLADDYLTIGTTFGGGEVLSLREALPRPPALGNGELVDELLAAAGDDPYLIDLRALSGDDAALLDQHASMRVMEEVIEVPVRQAFDLLVYVPRLSLWRSAVTPPVPHVR